MFTKQTATELSFTRPELVDLCRGLGMDYGITDPLCFLADKEKYSCADEYAELTKQTAKMHEDSMEAITRTMFTLFTEHTNRDVIVSASAKAPSWLGRLRVTLNSRETLATVKLRNLVDYHILNLFTNKDVWRTKINGEPVTLRARFDRMSWEAAIPCTLLLGHRSRTYKFTFDAKR